MVKSAFDCMSLMESVNLWSTFAQAQRGASIGLAAHDALSVEGETEDRYDQTAKATMSGFQGIFSEYVIREHEISNTPNQARIDSISGLFFKTNHLRPRFLLSLRCGPTISRFRFDRMKNSDLPYSL